VALGAAAAPALAGCSHHSNAAATGPGDWVELEAAMKETTLDGHKVRLRAYNGKIPGPLIEARPGDTLRIRVKNSLPPYDSSAWTGDHNVPHGLDATNLHVHGLDVVPHIFESIGTSDPLAPQIVIGPGETKEYVFELPEDHPPGFNFYHPHKHGSTSVQVGSGLAGPIIVRGAIDEVPEIKAAREIVLAVMDIGLFPSEDDPDVWQYMPVQNAIWQTFGGFVTIFGKRTNLRGGFTTGDYALHYFLLNGEPFFKEEHDYTPGKEIEPKGTQLPVQRFTIAPGEVVRFRMLNGATDNMMPIVVDGHDMHLTAMDGVNFPETRIIPARQPGDKTEQVIVATGNRGLSHQGQRAAGRVPHPAAGADRAVPQERREGHRRDRGHRAAEEHGATNEVADTEPVLSADQARRGQTCSDDRVHELDAQHDQSGHRRRLSRQQRHLRRERDTRRHSPQ
jgi:FtsP/CotA-like multicopper oxidase with cupredoxin domain